MAAGVYIVTVTGVNVNELTASTAVEASNLANIKFLSEVAVKKGNDVTVSVFGENQYGEDITYRLNNANVSSSAGISTSILNGVITVKGTSSDYFKTNQIITISIVDVSTGKSAIQAVKVADPPL